MGMKTGAVTCLGPHGFHRLAYVEWAGPAAPTVLCAHGLTRSGRDFDVLAEALSQRFRVVCPDYPGRGKSEWLSHPADYSYAVYMGDLTALIARLDVADIIWVGTSMGGLTGMLMAAQPGTPIRRLVVNDIGPWVAKEGLERIKSYVGGDPRFPSFEAFLADFRRNAATFGPLSDAQFRMLAESSVRRFEDGTYGYGYDPRIADAFEGEVKDIDLWPVWDAITCPTLVLRGAESDLLKAADAKAMTERGPRARLVEFPGIGHAPALMAEDQIATIVDFLAGG
jgi:pimeloyl-ACP methyl ester carboxylesterase